MAGFKADEAVEKLEWDFTRYNGGRGVSGEPSHEALVRFQRKYGAFVEALRRYGQAIQLREQKRLDAMSEEERRAELERLAASSFEDLRAEAWEQGMALLPDEERAGRVREMTEMVAEVFENNPSVEQIEKLPGRVRAAYFGWVVGQLINPESGAVGTN